MKTRLAFLLAIALTASFNASAASPATSSPIAFDVAKVNQPNNVENVHLQRGDTLMTARRLLGAPHRQLSANVWVYYGFHPETANALGCDTLVVTFAQNKVSDLKIVNERAVQVIAANLKPVSNTVLVAHK